MGFIYIIRCSLSKKVYIGQTTEPHIKYRWKSHKSMANKYVEMKDDVDKKIKFAGPKCHLYYAMAKYGIENFNMEVLEEIPDDQLNDREEYWVDKYDAIENGYNIIKGGNRTVHTENMKKYISIRTKEGLRLKKKYLDYRANKDMLRDLPQYCGYDYNRGSEYIRIRRHPLCPNKVINFKQYHGPEGAYLYAKVFLEILETYDEIYNPQFHDPVVDLIWRMYTDSSDFKRDVQRL